MKAENKYLLLDRVAVWLTLLTIGTSCVESCQKNEPCKQIEHNISINDSDKVRVAYKSGLETLKFVHYPQGDTHEFVGQGWSHYQIIQNETGVECPDQYAKEGRELLFKSSTYSYSIELIQQIFTNTADTKLSSVQIKFCGTGFENESGSL